MVRNCDLIMGPRTDKGGYDLILGALIFNLASAYLIGLFLPVGLATSQWVRVVIFNGMPVALGILLIGAVADSVRYSAWKKATKGR